MPRKLRSPKTRIVELTVQQLWELTTGISIHPDHWCFTDEAEMRQAWIDHEDIVREYAAHCRPDGPIWIEQIGGKRCREKCE